MSDDWITPKRVYADLDREFHFNDDPCGLGMAGLPLMDGLSRSWGSSTFVNPPYSKPRPWIQKAIAEAKMGKTIAMLLRADTSTSWFHDLVLPNGEIRWIRGRVQFTNASGRVSRCPFATMIVVFRGIA